MGTRGRDDADGNPTLRGRHSYHGRPHTEALPASIDEGQERDSAAGESDVAMDKSPYTWMPVEATEPQQLEIAAELRFHDLELLSGERRHAGLCVSVMLATIIIPDRKTVVRGLVMMMCVRG